MAPPITPPIECTCAVLANSQIICGTVHAVSLVPRPLSEKSRRVWQHVLHCSVQKEFNQLLNHVLMFTRASGNWMCDQPAVSVSFIYGCMQYLCVGHRIMEQCRFRA